MNSNTEESRKELISTYSQDGWKIFRVEEKVIDFSNAKRTFEKLGNEVKPGLKMCLDLTLLLTIDPSCCEYLLWLSRVLEKQDGALAVVCSESIVKILGRLKLNGFVNINMKAEDSLCEYRLRR